MKKIAVIAAMTKEYLQIRGMLSDVKESVLNGNPYVEGYFGNLHIGLVNTGIGKVCAAVHTADLIRTFQPDYVLNTGVSGGIDKSLRVMDVVFSTKVAYHDVWCGEGEYGQVQGFPLYFEASAELLPLVSALKTEVNVCKGLLLCGDRFISDRNELETIKSKFPEGMAVDMESAAIAQVCHMYGVPFMSMRIISDTPGDGGDNMDQYLDFWKTMAEKSFAVCRSFLELLSSN